MYHAVGPRYVEAPPPVLAHTRVQQRILNVFHCVFKVQSQLRASVFKGSTLQETPMATVARTPKAPLPNVKQGKT